MANRKRFNQTAILRFLGARCRGCDQQIPRVTLTLHHKDGRSDNDSWDNIAIYCRGCHDKLEGRDKKKRDLR